MIRVRFLAPHPGAAALAGEAGALVINWWRIRSWSSAFRWPAASRRMGQRKSANGFPLSVLAFRVGGIRTVNALWARLYSAVIVRVSVLLVVVGIGEP